MGQRLPLQTVYKLVVCIWLKQAVYSIKKILPVPHRLLLWEICVCPACFGVYMDTQSCAAEELSSSRAELLYILSRSEEFIFKSSNFSLCGLFSSPWKGCIISCKKAAQAIWDKRAFLNSCIWAHASTTLQLHMKMKMKMKMKNWCTL